MLWFLLILAAIGAFLGLIFSKRGDEGNATLRGAKTGLRIGCIIIVIFVVLLVIAFIHIMQTLVL